MIYEQHLNYGGLVKLKPGGDIYRKFDLASDRTFWLKVSPALELAVLYRASSLPAFHDRIEPVEAVPV